MTRSRILATIGLLVSLAVAACSTPPPTLTPQERMTTLEAELAQAEGVEVDFRITAEGAVAADLLGVLQIEKDTVEWTARGAFAGRDVDLELTADATELTLRAGERTRTMPRPPALTEAILVGMTRMGLLHNLAMMTSGQPPDHGDGGARDWVQLSDFKHDEVGGIVFAITVDGEPSGTASLRLAGDSGMPIVRRQTVKFESGGMEVVERYSRMDLR